MREHLGICHLGLALGEKWEIKCIQGEIESFNKSKQSHSVIKLYLKINWRSKRLSSSCFTEENLVLHSFTLKIFLIYSPNLFMDGVCCLYLACPSESSSSFISVFIKDNLVSIIFFQQPSFFSFLL